MKSSTRDKIRNILVSILLVGSAAFFGWLFRSELNRTVDNVGGVIVGEIVEIRGQAQRRYDRQSRWSNLSGSEDVYNFDAIRTSADSGAVIVLKSIDEKTGNELFDEISLGPDTYIILDLFGKTRNINFVGGNISATGAEGLTVSSEDTLVTVDQGSVNLIRSEGEQTSVTVTEGEATVNTRDGTTTVGTESILRINEQSGTAIREQVALIAQFPRSNALLLTYNEERRVDFKWELIADWLKPTLELSSTSSFRDIDAEVYRVEADAGATLQLPPGLWYWRVVDAGSEESGPINVFSVEREREAEPISPVTELVIPFRSNAPAVSLQWTRAWFADSYTLEMSRNASFTETPVVREVSGSSILMEQLSEGSWWWRVTPEYRRGILESPPTVETRRFVLERRVGHNQIALINPADNTTISALDVRDGVPFRWQDQEDLISYQIRVASNESFTNILADSDGPDNWRTLLPAPEPAKYYWRVEALAADGLPVPVSETRSFTIRPLSGSVELIDPAPGETREIEPYSSHTFIWRSEIPGTARFQLDRIGDGFDGTAERVRIIESLVRGETFTAPLPGEGNYIWKIQILDENSRTLVESREASFILRSEFSPPVLNTPSPGSVINLIGSSAVSLSWDPSPGADAYKVVLKAPDGTIINRDDRTISLEREFTLSSGKGNYTVELTSIRNNPPPGASKTSATASYRFEVGDFIQYSAAQPLSPPNGAEISALESLRNGLSLNWTQDPPLDRYTVEIDNGRVTRLYQTTESYLNLESLDSGNYSWVVKSRDSFGQEAPESRKFRFTIGELPSLSRPVITSPLPGENVDMTGRRNLVFKWQNVNGAEFYDLALYVEGSALPLLRERGLSGTGYTLNNLRILDVGNFILTIKARTEYEDVGVTRTSPELRVPFSLSVNIADTAPTILTDELQYAE